MAISEREKALIVAKYIQTGSVTTTQRWGKTRMQKTPPSRNTIIRWHNLSWKTEIWVRGGQRKAADKRSNSRTSSLNF